MKSKREPPFPVKQFMERIGTIRSISHANML